MIFISAAWASSIIWAARSSPASNFFFPTRRASKSGKLSSSAMGTLLGHHGSSYMVLACLTMTFAPNDFRLFPAFLNSRVSAQVNCAPLIISISQSRVCACTRFSKYHCGAEIGSTPWFDMGTSTALFSSNVFRLVCAWMGETIATMKCKMMSKRPIFRLNFIGKLSLLVFQIQP